jgi:pimeloyl-ACP methyl ester carboxylesterase
VFAADPVVRRVCNADGAIKHWSEFARGGHFAAMERPEELTSDVRTFFRNLR